VNDWQEISEHGDALKKVEDSNKSLQLEVKRLTTDRRSVRQAMFPELYSLTTATRYTSVLSMSILH